MDENKEVKVEEVKEEKKENELKQETVKTFNEAKEQMKNINLKQEAEAGKGLIKKLVKSPLETIKEIAEDTENKTFKTALLLVAVWAVVALIDRLLYYATSKYISFNLLSTLKVTIASILEVLAMTVSVYLLNKTAKKSISKILTSVSIAYIPSILSSVLWLLDNLSSKLSDILSPVGGLLSVVTIVLMYHTVKALSNEADETKTLKLFIKVEAVFYVIAFAARFLGIYI